MLDIVTRVSDLFNALVLILPGLISRLGIRRRGFALTGFLAALIILVIIVAGGVIIYIIIVTTGTTTTTYP